MSADDVIRVLGLTPHPEGGYYRETFRDPVEPVAGRAASTAIYYLLREGEQSHWHRVDAAEVWLWHMGAPLLLRMKAAGAEGPARELVLGSDLIGGERPQIVVPARHWQSARALGRFTLVSCTVAPGFEFSGFEMAPPGFEP